jgi:hypothetical protein
MQESGYRLASWFLISLLFLYCCIRAVTIPITYDEAWTIGTYVDIPVINIINFTPVSANNHFLNSLLIKLCYFVFGKSDYAARIPALTGFLMYAYFMVRLSEGIKRVQLRFLLILLLFLNPLLLDFFSLARGYGLSMGLLAGAFYFLNVHLRSNEWRFFHYSTICFTLAVFANLTLLNVWLALFIIQLIRYRNQMHAFIKQVALHLILLGVVLYEPLRKLIKGKELWYGGSDGFYSDTLISLIQSAVAVELNDLYKHVIAMALILLLIIIVGSILGYFWLQGLNQLPFVLYVAIILVLVTFGSIVQHHLFGTKYLINRTALFYVPLLGLLVSFGVDFLLTYSSNLGTLFLRAFMTNAGILIAVNFSLSANLTSTKLWPTDAHTPEILQFLSQQQEIAQQQVIFTCSWPFSASVQHYLKKGTVPNLRFVNRIYPHADSLLADVPVYFIYYDKDIKESGYYFNMEPIRYVDRELILSFPDESVYLYKIKRPKEIDGLEKKPS